MQLVLVGAAVVSIVAIQDVSTGLLVLGSVAGGHAPSVRLIRGVSIPVVWVVVGVIVAAVNDYFDNLEPWAAS